MDFIGKWKLTFEFPVQGVADELFGREIGLNSIFKSIYSEDPANDLHVIISTDITDVNEAIVVEVKQSNELVANDTYSLTLFNHQTAAEDRVTVTILQNIKEPFRKLSLLRLGPGPQECCCEHIIAERHDILRIVVVAATADGTLHSISRFFKRVLDYEVDNKKLDQFHHTLGWDVLKYWPCTAIELCELKVVRVLGMHAVPEPREDTLWSLEQSIEDIKKNTYTSEPYRDPANQLLFHIQITSGKSVWKVQRTHEEVHALIRFVRGQADPSDAALQKAAPNMTWKSYVEFHRMVLAIENILRTYFQNAAELHQNHVDSLCGFFQIPDHMDSNQVRLVESMIEEVDQEPVEGVRKFVSYRTDFIKLERLRLPTEEHKDPSPGPPSPVKPAAAMYQNNQFAPKSQPLLRNLSRRGSRMMDPQLVGSGDNASIHSAEETYLRPDADRTSMDSSASGVAHVLPVVAGGGGGGYGMQQTPATEPYSPQRPPPAAATVALTVPPPISIPANPPQPVRRLPSALVKSYSGSLEDINAIYDREISNTALKVMPVEVMSTAGVKSNIAKGLLYGVLEKGITFIKHGRQGNPKKKILKCDPQVTRLYWLSEKEAQDPLDDSKFIEVSKIQEIRVGTDIDPATPEEALQQAAADGSLSTNKLMKIAQLKESLGMVKPAAKPKGMFGGLFGGGARDEILYGTAALRRTCKPEHLPLCISLIMPDRTLDMQCLNQKDFNLLLINLREMTKQTAPGSPTLMMKKKESFTQNSLDRENPLKSSMRSRNANRKSVRFMGGEEAGAGDMDTDPSSTPKVASQAASMDLSFEIDDKSTGSGQELTTTSTDCIPGKVIFTMRSDGDLGHLLDVDPKDRRAATAGRMDSLDEDDDRPPPPRSPIRMSSTEALQIGMILSDQEKKHQTNMYESLKPEDQPTVQHHMNSGLTAEEAILRVFEGKFGGVGVMHSDEDEEEDGQRPQTESGRKSSFFPDLLDGRLELKMKATDALQVGLLLSQQEEEYGTNMYDSLKAEDEAEIRRIVATDRITTYEAILRIFEERFVNSQKPMRVHSDAPPGSPKGLQRAGSSFFPNTTTVLPPNLRTDQAPTRRLDSNEAMELAMLLSDQEARFGKNMYDSLTPEDEPELQSLLGQGYSMEKAVEIIFDHKYNPNGAQAAPAAYPTATAYAAPVAYGQPMPSPYMQPPPPYGYPPMPYYDQQGYPQQQQQFSPQGYQQGFGYPPPYGQQQGYGYPPMQGYPPSPYGMPPQGYYGYPPQPSPPGYPPQPGYGYPGQQQQGYEPYGQGFGPQGYGQPQGYPPQPPSAQAQAQARPAPGPPRGPPRGPPTPAAGSGSTRSGSLSSNSESFYGDIVPTELTALVNDGAPRPDFRRMTSNLGPAPAHLHAGHAGHTHPGQGIAHADSAPSNAIAAAAPVEAAPLSKQPPPRGITKKLSIFSRKSSTSDVNTAAFGLTSKNLKYKEADVKSIVAMGFTRDQAVWALVQNDNNVVNAIMSLTR